jgi:hypothetical protein
VGINLYYEEGDIYEDKALFLESYGGDPKDGQNFDVYVTGINESWRFYLEATDQNGSYTHLTAPGGSHFYVGSYVESNGNGNGGNGDNGGDGGGGIALPKGWFDNPEVLVGIIGLVALGCGSAYGVLRKRKKHGRFSELLTLLDEIYSSYKLNPKRCETELEKLKSTINDDLKKSVIDENNYSILKGRIDEIIMEIRSETMHSQVKELPKELELKIKDMLIDGEITRPEYDKLLPIIKGSDMASDDKEKTQKIIESWMKEKGDSEK